MIKQILTLKFLFFERRSRKLQQKNETLSHGETKYSQFEFDFDCCKGYFSDFMHLYCERDMAGSHQGTFHNLLESCVFLFCGQKRSTNAAEVFIVIAIAGLEEAMSRANAESITIPYGVGICGHVAETKETINIKDAYEVSHLFESKI